MRFLRLGTAGMRGRIGSGITPLLVIDYASALGTYVDGAPVVLARDSRFSSLMIKEAASSALMSCGCDVLDAGVCPAPAMQSLVPLLGARAGLLVGAGHHPADWNALVPISDTGAYMNETETQSLLDIYHSHVFNRRPHSEIGVERVLSESTIHAYLEKLSGALDVDSIANARFKVVMDLCNGSGGRLSAEFARRLGIDPFPINDEFSGRLPHDPEPRPRSAVQVKSLMRHLNADAGFVFNSDISRVSVVTNEGETLSEEYTFPLAADGALASVSKESPVVVTNSCTTRTADDLLSERGAVLEKTRVGQAAIVDKMAETGAFLGGDGSGSFAMSAVGPAFDGFLAMGKILESMAAKNATSAELSEALPKYHLRKLKVPCPSSHAYTLLRNLRDCFSDADFSEVDGCRFDWPDGWVHFRAAMTEPIIRVIVEWRTQEEADERALRSRGLIEQLRIGN